MNDKFRAWVKTVALICVLFMLVNICFVFLPHSDTFCDTDCVFCILIKISESVLFLCVAFSLVFGDALFSRRFAAKSNHCDKNSDLSLVALKVKLSN